ncbi:MAG: hypothetical protein V7K26_31030 [Nostoc sp.]
MTTKTPKPPRCFYGIGHWVLGDAEGGKRRKYKGDKVQLTGIQEMAVN